jgi:hypothetical protein
MFVQVFGRSISILRPSIAEALSAALDDELKVIMHELEETDAQNERHPIPTEEPCSRTSATT